jgi:hypothetical protein
MSEFESKVCDFIDIEDRLKAISDEAKQLRKVQKELTTHIIKFMKDVEKTRCETPSMNLLLSHNTTQATLSVPMLKTVFEEYFPGRQDISDGLISAIAEYRRLHAHSGIRLKKVRQRSKE